jgi:hypothetical protein
MAQTAEETAQIASETGKTAKGTGETASETGETASGTGKTVSVIGGLRERLREIRRQNDSLVSGSGSWGTGNRLPAARGRSPSDPTGHGGGAIFAAVRAAAVAPGADRRGLGGRVKRVGWTPLRAGGRTRAA